MASKPKRGTKRWLVLAAVEKYKEVLRMYDWEVQVVIYDTLRDIPRSQERTAAGCHAMSEYKQATIYFTLSEIAKDKIDATVCHELLHCILWPITHHMDRWAKGNEEREEIARYSLEEVTTALDRIVPSLVKEGK